MSDAAAVNFNRPLTILMAVPQYPYPIVGGLEKQAHELAVELVAQGHRVFALSGHVRPGGPNVSNVDGVTVHRFPWTRHRFVRWVASPVAVWLRFHRLAKGVDVVHVHSVSGFGLFLILLSRLYRKPVLVKLPNIGVEGLPGLVRSPFGRLRVRVFALADAVVAMTQDSLAELAAIGYDQRRVLATPNGICVQPAGLTQSASTNRECRFVFVGRLHDQKGLRDLLVAAKSLVANPTVGSFTIDLVGEGPMRAALQREIREAGLLGKVRLRGHTDEVRDVLPSYDVFVLPSHREGNSNSILEAMAAGLPVISTRVGGTPMLVGDSGARYLHEPRDAVALADAMKELIASATLRTDVGGAMRRRVEQCFDIRQVARTYARAYRLLASGRRNEIATVSNPVVIGCA